MNARIVLKIWICPDWSAGYDICGVVDWCVVRHGDVPQHTAVRHGEPEYTRARIQAITTFHVQLRDGTGSRVKVAHN